MTATGRTHLLRLARRAGPASSTKENGLDPRNQPRHPDGCCLVRQPESKADVEGRVRHQSKRGWPARLAEPGIQRRLGRRRSRGGSALRGHVSNRRRCVRIIEWVDAHQHGATGLANFYRARFRESSNRRSGRGSRRGRSPVPALRPTPFAAVPGDPADRLATVKRVRGGSRRPEHAVREVRQLWPDPSSLPWPPRSSPASACAS